VCERDRDREKGREGIDKGHLMKGLSMISQSIFIYKRVDLREGEIEWMA
jgi:hypothetical protein